MSQAKSRGLIRTLLLVASLLIALTGLAFSPGLNGKNNAKAASYGYLDTWYTDGTYSTECGYYNSCTRQRVGCQFTGYKITEIIPCG